MAKVIDGIHEATREEKYVKPKEKEVLDHLEWFKDQKLGLMMHWAPGSQFSVVESWSMVSNTPWDTKEGKLSPWMINEITWTDDIDEYREQLKNTNKLFNPIKFKPKSWAKMAKDCGFKYLLFTTKHHDGFCMFDSKYSNYKITAPECPFHTNKNANIVKALFESFREEGLGISAYFSKPDWASEYFWSSEFGKTDHINANYNPLEHPEIWQKFVEYTHNQLLELTTDYGKIDSLWLDGGWVNKKMNNQDIKLGEVVKKIRSTTQPDLIVVDRESEDEYENIITPEQTIPEEPINVPWESCVTLGDNFSYHFSDTTRIKSAREVIHMLISVVSKGGNLALNVTPQPDGELPIEVLSVLSEIGDWLKLNGEGIYKTRPIYPFNKEKVEYTYNKDNEAIFAFVKYKRDFHAPRSIVVEVNKQVKKVILLRTKEEVTFEQKNNYIIINSKDIPLYNMKYADCFKII